MNLMNLQRSVLITGASTGIGRATAEYLAEKGYYVYAGARKQKDIESLDSFKNIHAVKLDVTIQSQVDEAIETIKETTGSLFAIINNAGIAVAGPLMDIEVEEMRQQFEVNLYGVHRVTKAVFPLLLESKGRIVMMSSDSGFFATPFFGPYCSSKHALEGYSDSLRRELALYNIDVVKIQPGRITTEIWDKGEDLLNDFDKDSLFKKEALGIGEYAVRKGKNAGLKPVEVGKLVYEILTEENPKLSYLIAPSTFKYKMIKLFPEKWVDRMVVKELREYKEE